MDNGISHVTANIDEPVAADAPAAHDEDVVGTRGRLIIGLIGGQSRDHWLNRPEVAAITDWIGDGSNDHWLDRPEVT